jgi:hypothetical protein
MSGLRASDVLGKQVRHANGANLGVCHDIRAEVVAPLGARDAIRVTGIVVGRGAVGVRLGYGDPDMQGPWLLTQIFGRRARRARFVAWTDLRVEPDRIVVDADLDTIDLAYAVGRPS